MFDAIEDIPTAELWAEIRRRQPTEMRRYMLWNDHDPNDTFEVDAKSVDGAAWAALDELGWCVSADSQSLNDDYTEETTDATD